MANTTLTAVASVAAEFTLTKVLDLSSPIDTISMAAQSVFADGTGNNQADIIYADQLSISASSTASIDLSGSLLCGVGTPFVAARVKALLVYNASATAQISVGNDTNEWLFGAANSTIVLNAGAMTCMLAPGATAHVVTAGTGDIILITNNNGSNTATVQVIVIGASA